MVLSSEKNLYEILEVSSTASVTIIKSAYRKLARKYHPDLNSGDEFYVQKFKEITEAYEILSDADKKKNYDILRGIYQEPSRSKYSEAEKAYNKDFKDTKSSFQSDVFSSVFSDILEGFKKTTTSSKQKEFKTKQLRPEKGKDIYTDVVISLSEAVEGTSRTVNILHTEVCPNCSGRPFLNGQKCPLCKGQGEQSIHKKLNVKIPSGVKHGSKIRIANEGNRGYNGGKNGDLYLNVKIENDSRFKYDGLNVLCTVPITPFEAVLGANIKVPAISGTVSMKVTPNTHNGQKFRLAGQGLVQNEKKGDMIVTVTIEVPRNPSENEIKLYKELKEISKHDIRDNR